MKTLDHGVHSRGIGISGDKAGPFVVEEAGSLRALLSGPLGRMVSQHLRVLPRQVRSMESVERILSAAAQLAARSKGIEAVTLEAVANRAAVTPQAVYRYFRDVEDLTRIGFRCIAVREYETLLRGLEERRFGTEREVAVAAIGLIMASCDRLCDMPARSAGLVLREYRHLGYQASAILSRHLCADARRHEALRPLDAAKLATSLAASIAVATSVIAEDLPSMDGGTLRDTLVDMAVAITSSGEQRRLVG